MGKEIKLPAVSIQLEKDAIGAILGLKVELMSVLQAICDQLPQTTAVSRPVQAYGKYLNARAGRDAWNGDGEPRRGVCEQGGKNELAVKIPGKTPGLLLFWDIAEHTKTCYNKARKQLRGS